MVKRIIYAEHLLFRLKARRISKNLPSRIYRQAERLYFDRVTQLNIAVRDIFSESRFRTLMVAFTETKDTIKLITIHPLKSNQETNRIKSGRWLKIKKTI